MVSSRNKSLRSRITWALAILLVISFILTRRGDEDIVEEDLEGYSPYRPIKPQHGEAKGSPFSPLQALGLGHLVSGGRPRLLVVGGASQLGQSTLLSCFAKLITRPSTDTEALEGAIRSLRLRLSTSPCLSARLASASLPSVPHCPPRIRVGSIRDFRYHTPQCHSTCGMV